MSLRRDLKTAAQRALDAEQLDWYRERCARADEILAQLREAAVRVGLSVEPEPARTGPARTPPVAPRPRSSEYLRFAGEHLEDGAFRAEYGAELSVSLLADAYTTWYSVEIENAMPQAERIEPQLKKFSETPILSRWFARHAALEPELARLGLRAASRDELREYVPAFEYDDAGSYVRDVPSVGAALYHTLPGESLAPTPVMVEGMARLRAMLDAPAPVRVDDVVEGELRRREHRFERMRPGAWRVHFDEVRDGAFHARFTTEIEVSARAPLWRFEDRFTVAHPHPDAVEPELSDGIRGDYGYTKSQTACVHALGALLAERGVTLFDDRFEGLHVPSAGGYARMDDLMFGSPVGE